MTTPKTAAQLVAEEEQAQKRSALRIRLLGAFLIGAVLVLAFAILLLWPAPGKPGANGEPAQKWAATVRYFGWELNADLRMLLLVLLVAGLGSCVHAATSFCSYVGNERLLPSWTWWYVMRPFIGLALGLIFYFVLRGGLLSASSDASELNLHGMVAVAGLAGMFSKQAIDKLREVFDNLFRTAANSGDAQRSGKLARQRDVKEQMIPIEKMACFTIPEGQGPQDVKIREIEKKYGGVVTRLPILDSEGLVCHVIHQSLIYKFISAASVEAADHRQPLDLDQLTLQKFLDFKDMQELVTESRAFVPLSASIGQAKKTMEDTPKCQDVFVTETGAPSQPVQGWLTNVEIGRISEA